MNHGVSLTRDRPLSRRWRRPALLLIAFGMGFASRLAAQVQLGLRLDSKSSIQWSGPTIYLEADERATIRTSVAEIYDVWPAPVRGVFGVSTSDGLGLLLGRDVSVGGYLLDSRAIVRSSRPDVLFAAVRSSGARQSHEPEPSATSRPDVTATSASVAHLNVKGVAIVTSFATRSRANARKTRRCRSTRSWGHR